MTFDNLLIERDGAVAIVTFNRPKVLNALNSQTLTELAAAMAAFKEHCSLFPASGGVIERFTDELKGYGLAKGTIRFPIGEPLPAPLVKKIVKARLEELKSADLR